VSAGSWGNYTSALARRSATMTLYCDRDSPFGHAVRIVLAEKDVNVEVHYVDEENRPEDVVDLNPYEGVLTMLDRDLVLYEAQIMMEYLDDRYPHPPLMPVDPASRANNRQLRYRIMRDLYALVKPLCAGGEESTVAMKSMRDHLTAIAPAFTQKPYFLSEEYSLTDCCMAPLLWRLDHYRIRLPAQAQPLEKYAARLFVRPAFRASLSTVERGLRMR
jgi:RNA polymerase-associated protein